jgi:hypothetical protein
LGGEFRCGYCRDEKSGVEFARRRGAALESALDPLCDRADFKKLVAELEKNSPPQQEKE